MASSSVIPQRRGIFEQLLRLLVCERQCSFLPLFTSSSPFAKTYEEMSQLGVYRLGEDRFSASQGAGFLSLSLPLSSQGVSGSSIVSQHSGLFTGSQTWGLRNTAPEPALLFPLSTMPCTVCYAGQTARPWRESSRARHEVVCPWKQIHAEYLLQEHAAQLEEEADSSLEDN